MPAPLQTVPPQHPAALFAPLGHSAGMPLFRLVKRRLVNLIETRHFAPGDCLPSESALAGALQVSIGTVRKAVDELVHETVLLRRQGKGTFVTRHNPDRFLFQFFHVQKRTQDLDLEPEYPLVQCVSFEKGRASTEEAVALGLRDNDPVFHIVNRLCLEDRATVVDRICISALTFKGLTQKRFTGRKGTIYQLYQEDFGITVLRAHERARAAMASRDIRRILGITAELPVLEVHRVALSFGEKPVEYRVSTIDTREHDYVSTLTKRG